MRQIAEIDRDINATTRQLRHLERVNVMSAESWQNAWDKHPDLENRFRALYLERGLAQRERDEKAHKMVMREQRARRYKKCPTCKAKTLIAA